MGEFKTIKEDCICEEIVEKKSRFIANLMHVESEEKIKQIKKRFHDAKHNCFAYLVYEDGNMIKKSSDDGEPSGTAGSPMMEIIEKNNIGNVLVVVTRYFGGILLGTGGLVRAYSDALKKAIDSAQFVTLETGHEAKVKIDYSDFEKLKYFCNKKNVSITKTDYTDNVECIIEVNDTIKDEIEKDINGLIKRWKKIKKSPF